MQKENNYTCHTEKEGDTCLCPLEGIINTLSKKWTLQIVAVIGNHKRLRYNEILTKLEGISTKSLADRLKEMKLEGLIKRKAFAEIPPPCRIYIDERRRRTKKGDNAFNELGFQKKT